MASFEYGSAIKIIFDLPIVSEVSPVSGSEYYEPAIALDGLLSSGDNASYPKTNAFDGNTASYWRASGTTAGQWIGRDCGRAITITKASARFDYSSGRPTAYALQGSNDGSSWNTVASGNFANASGWQDVVIAATTYRYWRLYFSSKYSSYYTCTEFKLYGTRDTYNISGWSVQGYEPAQSPGGAPVLTSYLVRKITKADADYSLILWLALSGRMKYPQGDVTITFTGSMTGPGNAAVAPFVLAFTPTNITPIFNPGQECAATLAAAAISTAAIYTVAYSSHEQPGDAAVTMAAAAVTSAVLTHIDDLET